MRNIGDEYVRNEFKLHKNAKPEFLNKFFTEWELYLFTIRSSKDKYGVDLNDRAKDLTKEQQIKLQDLKNQASNIKF